MKLSKKTIKIISLVLVFVMVANMLLFGFGIIGVMEFWLIIGVGALFSYRYLGWMKKDK